MIIIIIIIIIINLVNKKLKLCKIVIRKIYAHVLEENKSNMKLTYRVGVFKLRDVLSLGNIPP